MPGLKPGNAVEDPPSHRFSGHGLPGRELRLAYGKEFEPAGGYLVFIP